VDSKTPLVQVYGDNAEELSKEAIRELSKNSNIPFDAKYVELGISFLMLKCDQILKGEKTKSELVSLISESFGEAAIYKYNIAEGTL
jgi:hypothetical protein